ncbi:ABC transporter substrate-binding protein [Streptomyces sp. AJS327]|uniref:ABC transporter substrate-binding protein n=1 Tax=Streptomyces sp. AJS327 TaxID=2545265 RepID=UPI0015DEC295|nr:ABC transporter substrate-binding protein [Streptomyces sp. AJS327]MBA0050219.1 ABC transporter substrate-binding protein [Streptomyces sp. AJS327]
MSRPLSGSTPDPQRTSGHAPAPGPGPRGAPVPSGPAASREAVPRAGSRVRRPARRSRAVLRGLLAALLLIPLAACGESPEEVQSGSGGGGGGEAKGFPRTISNCGVRTTFDEPPRRVVAMNQHATEAMLALGLEDRLVGTAYLDDAVLPRYEKAYRSVKVLAKRYPSREVLLSANPDFVYGGYSSAFDKGEGRDRAALKESGIRSRLNIEGCRDDRTGPAELRRELLELGRTFGVEKRAEKLVRDGERQLARTAARLKGVKRPSVFVYDGGDASAYTSGGHGIGNEIIKRAGGRNVFASLRRPFADVSWEQVVKKRPEAIVIYDYGGTPLAAKKRKLLEDPALRDIPAVKNKRFAVLPLSSAVLGVRVPDAVDELAGQLHPDTAE